MMAGYGGFFLKGLAGGISTGFEMGWKKKQEKKLETKQKELLESASIFNNLIKQLGEDGAYSDDDMMKVNTAYWAAGYETQELIKGSYEAIKTMNQKKFDEDMALLDAYVSWTKNLKPDDIAGIFNEVEGWVKTEKGKRMFTAYNNISVKRYEALQTQPTAEVFPSAAAAQEAYPDTEITFNASAGGFVPKISAPEAPKLSEEKSAVDRLISIATLPKATYDSQLQSYINRGLDVGMYTQDVVKQLDTEGKKYYSSAEEAMSKSSDFKGLDKQPVQMELNKWKIDYTKKTVPTPTPEGEITAGQKRVTDTAQSELFGGKDSMGMPISVGIIPMDVQMSIGTGRELTEEEKRIVLNNYDLRKDILNESVREYIESILKQLGVDLEGKPKPIPEPEVKKTGIIQSIKDWWKGTPQETTPKTETDYWTDTYGF